MNSFFLFSPNLYPLNPPILKDAFLEISETVSCNGKNTKNRGMGTSRLFGYLFGFYSGLWEIQEDQS